MTEDANARDHSVGGLAANVAQDFVAHLRQSAPGVLEEYKSLAGAASEYASGALRAMQLEGTTASTWGQLGTVKETKDPRWPAVERMRAPKGLAAFFAVHLAHLPPEPDPKERYRWNILWYYARADRVARCGIGPGTPTMMLMNGAVASRPWGFSVARPCRWSWRWGWPGP